MQNKLNKPIDTHSSLRICPAHLEYARELDRNHGRAIAKNYLRQVTSPDYMSPHKLGAVKHAERAMEKTLALMNVPCPPEGWETATRAHIQRVGSEIVERHPGIEPKELEKSITQTYPFGPKANHSYKVWRKQLKAYIDQVKLEQLGRQIAQSYTPEQQRRSA